MLPLTSTRLLVVLGLLVLVLFAAIVLGRPARLTRRLPALTRAVLVLLLNVCVLTLAGAALNDQYLFYVSWGDLLGTESGVTHVLAAGNEHAGAKIKLADGLHALPPGSPLPPLPSPGQREQQYTVTGPASHETGAVIVWLPKGYNPKAARTYPVIMSLAGYPATVGSNFQAFSLRTTYDQVVDAHTITPPIIVMPQMNVPQELDTECIDAPEGRGPLTETWLSRDIPDWIVAHFRVRTDRSSWALQGYSFGGWCSALLAMRHPQVFGASIVLMGYFEPEFSAVYDPLVPGTPLARSYDLVYLARKHPPAVSIFVFSSKRDPQSYPATTRFLKAARNPMSVTAYITSSGGHRVSTMEPIIKPMLSWLAKAAPGFRP